MARNPELRVNLLPLQVIPKRTGIILTANYEARKYGVKTTMLVHQARSCPDLILVPPHHGIYEENSRKVMNILSRYSPVVQQNSIDEAWLDMTGCEALFGNPLTVCGENHERYTK